MGHQSKPRNRRVSNTKVDDTHSGPSFLCPDYSYTFDFKEIVDLGWSNIEKVWLDGCFIKGSIPDEMPDKWPKMISLDLYGNSMEGTIPTSLGRLPFVKLQLQSNNFSGVLPRNVGDLITQKHEMILGLGENPLLTGCVPSRYHFRETQLKQCSKVQKGEL